MGLLTSTPPESTVPHTPKEDVYLDKSQRAKQPKSTDREVRRSHLASEIEYSVKKRLGSMRRIKA